MAIFYISDSYTINGIPKMKSVFSLKLNTSYLVNYFKKIILVF